VCAADALVSTVYTSSTASMRLGALAGRPVVRIGDCVRRRRIFDAVHEADRAVTALEAVRAAR
jgi:hypothetical protein